MFKLENLYAFFKELGTGSHTNFLFLKQYTF